MLDRHALHDRVLDSSPHLDEPCVCGFIEAEVQRFGLDDRVEGAAIGDVELNSTDFGVDHLIAPIQERRNITESGLNDPARLDTRPRLDATGRNIEGDSLALDEPRFDDQL